MWPFEQTGGMGLLEIRKRHPDLVMSGGISKAVIAQGRDAIDRALEPMEAMLRHGGYIPHADHLVPPDVSFEDFSYYRRRLNELIDTCGGPN